MTRKTKAGLKELLKEADFIECIRITIAVLIGVISIGVIMATILYLSNQVPFYITQHNFPIDYAWQNMVGTGALFTGQVQPNGLECINGVNVSSAVFNYTTQQTTLQYKFYDIQTNRSAVISWANHYAYFVAAIPSHHTLVCP